DEAVTTLEAVTQRVHTDYLTRLSELERELTQVRKTAGSGAHDATQRLQLDKELRTGEENARRAGHRAQSLEQQLMAAVGQLEQSHIELHRRHEALRQKTRTLYLLERALALDNVTREPGPLVNGLLAMVGDDMQAQRCSLMLR